VPLLYFTYHIMVGLGTIFIPSGVTQIRPCRVTSKPAI
jgi:hypothetical protein